MNLHPETPHLKFQILANIAHICAQKGMRNVIVSPGSRSAPLTVAFARAPGLNCRVIIDERSAAHIALGLAQQTGLPTALICTSGTAGLNYAPAVIEAYYQRLPLIIFTADRPPEWIDQQDGQTIRQDNLYGSHTQGSFSLPVDFSHPDGQWHAQRIISEALNLSLWPVPGPVHINVPLREPLYLPPEIQVSAQPQLKIIEQTPSVSTLPASLWQALQAEWQSYDKILVAGGMASEAPPALNKLQSNPAVAIIADVTANLHQDKMALPCWDMVLGQTSLEELKPDLLVTFGGPIVSKYLKLFLRHHPPQAHWHIDPAGKPIDTYQALSRVIPLTAETVFAQISTFVNEGNVSDYANIWRDLNNQAQTWFSQFINASPFGEFQAMYHIIKQLPEPSRLQLSNSMPIRYANFIGLAGQAVKVNGNRGASGIDGCVSTAVGAALATDEITTLISGDLAFFYDRNALWHNCLPPNLRIIVLNNGGGGIFKLIEGPSNLPQPELSQFFFTPHTLTAKNTANDHNCAYFFADNLAGLTKQLPVFFAPASKAAIFEIATDSEINADVFKRFKAGLKNIPRH